MISRNSDVEVPPRVRRPDFMIIGSMKSGTTTLYQYLGKHPGIFMCSPKEPMFFSREEVYARGLDWYFSLFREAGDDQVCGEASTCYSRWPYFGDVAARIHDAVPDTKFIYVMRHPVERAYSHYRHEMEEREVFRRGKLITFEEALEQEPVIFETSLYHRQICKFFDYFPLDRFLLLFFEELASNAGPILTEVQQFLGLAQESALLESEVIANSFGSVKTRVTARRLMISMRQFPGIPTVRKVLPSPVRAWIGPRLERAVTATIASRPTVSNLNKRLSPLDAAVRNRLLQRFSVANSELEQLMGRHVPPSWHE